MIGNVILFLINKRFLNFECMSKITNDNGIPNLKIFFLNTIIICIQLVSNENIT